MRIAYVCADPGVPVFGQKGCSVHVQEVVRGLIRNGAEVELFATRAEGEPPLGLECVRTHPLPVVPKGELAAREQAALGANNGLRAALEHANSFDMIYERYSLWSFAGMQYAHEHGIPGLLEVNTPLIEEQAEHRGLVDHVAAVRVAEQVFAAATVLMAVSEEVARYLACYSNTPVQLVPNGVDPGRFPVGLTPSRPARQGEFTVGFVGTLKPWHGLSVLIDAFAMLRERSPDVRLLIVGDGGERINLKKSLSARGLCEAVHLTGAVAPGEVPGLLASMDVAVAPYPRLLHFYFSPLKVYEYMAAGVPVVASRIGQLDGLIRDGNNGLLCPPGDAAALAAALDRLRRAPALGRRLANTARANVLEHHTWDAVVRRILDLAGFDSATPERQSQARIEVRA